MMHGPINIRYIKLYLQPLVLHIVATSWISSTLNYDALNYKYTNIKKKSCQTFVLTNVHVVTYKKTVTFIHVKYLQEQGQVDTLIH